MNDQPVLNAPPVLSQIQTVTEEIGFQMASDPLTGSLLRTLAATKPAGSILELGTGTGVATAWLLDGMDEHSRLVSVEKDEAVLAVAQKFLGDDRRAGFFHADGAWWLDHAELFRFDLI